MEPQWSDFMRDLIGSYESLMLNLMTLGQKDEEHYDSSIIMIHAAWLALAQAPGLQKLEPCTIMYSTATQQILADELLLIFPNNNSSMLSPWYPDNKESIFSLLSDTQEPWRLGRKKKKRKFCSMAKESTRRERKRWGLMAQRRLGWFIYVPYSGWKSSTW